jgi:hypothetical protein
MITWDQLYNLLGIKDFIYYISSPQLQDMLFPVKLIFVTFAMFFLAGVIYFMINSSWLKYKFLEDVTEFFAWQAYGQRQISKQWAKIKKRTESGTEADYKLAIIDADDMLTDLLDEAGFEGKDFGDSLKKAGRLVSGMYEQVMEAHEIRNSIVYNPDFKLTTQDAEKALSAFENAINAVGAA